VLCTKRSQSPFSAEKHGILRKLFGRLKRPGTPEAAEMMIFPMRIGQILPNLPMIPFESVAPGRPAGTGAAKSPVIA